MAALTLLTVQNTVNVLDVKCLDAELVQAQIRTAVSDIPPAAAKSGALGNEAIIRTVAELAANFSFPLVVDPVMVSKHGAPLLSPAAGQALLEHLLPHAAVVTPNLPEASALTGIEITGLEQMKEAARCLHDRTGASILLKGGHLEGLSVDVLLYKGDFFDYPEERIETRHTHGTGCTFSAAITALLARGGTLPSVVAQAKSFITKAILTNPGLGHGTGPVNHFAAIEDRTKALN